MSFVDCAIANLRATAGCDDYMFQVLSQSALSCPPSRQRRYGAIMKMRLSKSGELQYQQIAVEEIHAVDTVGADKTY
jgi:hypothetical protein